MTAQDAKNHMADIRDQLSHEMFHEQSLIREIELLKPTFESKIVMSSKNTDLRNLKQEDLNIDVVPANLANMETILARKAYYYAVKDLAQVRVTIATLTDLYNTYKAHMAQELQKNAANCSDKQIYDVYSEAMALKDQLADQEREALEAISNSMMKLMNSGPAKRIEMLETLQNIVKQHKSKM